MTFLGLSLKRADGRITSIAIGPYMLPPLPTIIICTMILIIKTFIICAMILIITTIIKVGWLGLLKVTSHTIPCSTALYHAIPHKTILCNTIKYMQYQAMIFNTNTMQYVPWRGVICVSKTQFFIHQLQTGRFNFNWLRYFFFHATRYRNLKVYATGFLSCFLVCIFKVLLNLNFLSQSLQSKETPSCAEILWSLI